MLAHASVTVHTAYHCARQKAIEIVQKAIDEDVKQNYQEAYKLYQNSLDYFMMAMKCK